MGFKQTLAEYPNGFIRDLNLDLNLDDYDFDNELDMDRMDTYYEKLEGTVLNWFNQCWIKAGGIDVEGNYSISSHDSGKAFDLINQKWMDH